MVLGNLVQFFTTWQFHLLPPYRRQVGNSYVYRSLPGNTWPPNAGALWTAWGTSVFNSVLGACQVSYTSPLLSVILPLVSQNPVFTANWNVGGGRGGDHMPISMCVRVTLKTALRGRVYRGSKLFSPVAVMDVAGDELSPSGFAVWSAAVAPLSADLVFSDGGLTQTYRPVVWSRSLTPGPPFVPPAQGADLTSLVVNRTLGTLRHRKERTVR